LIRLFIYQVGVPVFYALTLFKNSAELNELQHLELSIANEENRVKLGNYLKGNARREYQPEIDEAELRQQELKEQLDAKSNLLPGKLRKLTAGYELRTYGFEVFECIRKMLLILVPIFFEPNSPEQLTIGLIVCFITYGAYMMYSPFIDPSDDMLSQVCQMQIFFSLLSSLILSTNPNSPTMAVLLPIMMLLPCFTMVSLQLGLHTALLKCIRRADNGVPTPCGRVGKGFRGKALALLKRVIGMKDRPVEEDEDDGTPLTLFGAGAVPPRIKNIFSRHDLNQNGRMEYGELRAALSDLGFDSSYELAAKYLSQYEAQPTSQMDMIEFSLLIHNLEAAPKFTATTLAPVGSTADDNVPDRVKIIFARHDTNENGTLDYRELRGALIGLGFDATHPLSAEYIKKYDDTPDGVMQLREFSTLVRNLEDGIVRTAMPMKPAELPPPHFEQAALSVEAAAPAPAPLTPTSLLASLTDRFNEIRGQEIEKKRDVLEA